MNIIKVKISKDRSVEFERISGGVIGENGVCELKFVIPEEYSEFYKYLDIIKTDGSKTQTVVGDNKNNVFYYTIPYSLTEGPQLYLQLVAKNKNKVFKSNLFTVYFNGSIDATQILSGDYQDTIEYLMENKSDIKDVEFLNKKLDGKVSNDVFLKYKTENEESLTNKVDKEKNKGLSSNDYTDAEKEKLSELPTNGELEKDIDSRIAYLNLGIISEELPNPADIPWNTGLYHLCWDSNGTGNKTGILLVEDYDATSTGYLITSGITYKVYQDQDWEIIDNQFTTVEKEKLSALPTNEELNEKIEEINIAHNSDFDMLQAEVNDNKNNISHKVSIIEVPLLNDDPSDPDNGIPIDEICNNLRTEGVYYIYQHRVSGMSEDVIGIYRLTVMADDTIQQYLEDCDNGMIRYRNGFGLVGADEWSEWIDYNYSYSKQEIDSKLGDIESALDELHNYAQALISGGVE